MFSLKPNRLQQAKILLLSKPIVLLLFALLPLFTCQSKKSAKEAFLPESVVYQAKDYTELIIDSPLIQSYFKDHPAPTPIVEDVQHFYSRRNFQFAWFTQNGISPAAANFISLLESYKNDFDDHSLDNVYLDTLFPSIQSDEKAFLKNIQHVLDLELLLTTQFFKYAKKVYGGSIDNPLDLNWFIPSKKKNFQTLLDTLVSISDGQKIQEPINPYYLRLKEKLIQYRQIQKTGGLPTVYSLKEAKSKDDSTRFLLNLKTYLFLLGDLRTTNLTQYYDDSTMKSIAHFQRRFGLKESGELDKATLYEMNQPISLRIKQMMLNMERLRWLPLDIENKYILVNIPAFRLYIFDSSKPVESMNVVVGKEATETIIFKGKISTIIINPYWEIPYSIAKNEIIPHLKRNRNYLKSNNMEVLVNNVVINPNTIRWRRYSTNFPFKFRQKPGPDNALGKIKFLFPNNYNIYLHDAPSKHLFERSKRAFSHGCIRVADPIKLALYILKSDTTWNAQRIDSTMMDNTPYPISIKPSFPVYITYFTSWADSKGDLHFRDDLYGLDKKLSAEIFGSE